MSKLQVLVKGIAVHEDMLGSESIAPSFLTSALDGNEWSTSLPGEICPDTYWIGDWVSPSGGMDAVDRRKILPFLGIEPWPSSPVARRYTD
jgi:hypothetical protein